MGMIKLPEQSVSFFEDHYSEIFESGNLAEGKWISESESTDGEIIVYEFENNETLKMYFDGKELPTKKPIEYKIIENKNRTEIEIEYVSPWNNSTEKMYGLIEFLKNGKIKMEFFPFDEQVGKKNEFSKEAVIFKKV